MNNEDKILDAIRLEAEGKAEQIKGECDARIAEVKTDCDNRIRDMRAKNAAKRERERDVILRRGRSSADMRRREIMLGARVDLLDRAYADAERFICEMDRDAYAGLLANMLASALADRIAEDKALAENGEAVNDTSFEVAFNERDRAELGERVIEMALRRLASDRSGSPAAALTEKLARANNDDAPGARAVAQALERIAANGGAPSVTLAADTVSLDGGFILRSGDISCDCSIKTLVASSRASTEADVARVLFQ